MTDLEITKLCAEAMGWKHLGAIGHDQPEEHPTKLWCLSGGNDWWQNPEGSKVCGRCESIPDPLHDDAQAMALVKKMRLSIVDPSRSISGKEWGVDGADDIYNAASDDLNRAICECIAKLRQAKNVNR